MYLVVNKDF